MIFDPVIRRAKRVLIAFWARREPPHVPGRHYGPAVADNVQRTMNLIMPLAHPGPETTAQIVKLLRQRADDLYSGLDNVGTVHFARFLVIDGNLQMISVFDGDIETYIRDFIASIGHVFDAALAFVKDPPPLPTAENPARFVDWVYTHDLIQMPDDLTELVDDLSLLPRSLLTLTHTEPDSQLGMYRAYAGYSAAQIRQALGLDWGEQ